MHFLKKSDDMRHEPFRLEKFHKAPSYRLDSSYHLFVLVNDKLVVNNLMNFPK